MKAIVAQKFCTFQKKNLIFFKVYDIPCKLTFTLVRPLTRLNVVNVATGSTHSAVIDSKFGNF